MPLWFNFEPYPVHIACHPMHCLCLRFFLVIFHLLLHRLRRARAFHCHWRFISHGVSLRDPPTVRPISPLSPPPATRPWSASAPMGNSSVDPNMRSAAEDCRFPTPAIHGGCIALSAFLCLLSGLARMQWGRGGGWRGVCRRHYALSKPYIRRRGGSTQGTKQISTCGAFLKKDFLQYADFRGVGFQRQTQAESKLFGKLAYEPSICTCSHS